MTATQEQTSAVSAATARDPYMYSQAVDTLNIQIVWQHEIFLVSCEQDLCTDIDNLESDILETEIERYRLLYTCYHQGSMSVWPCSRPRCRTHYSPTCTETMVHIRMYRTGRLSVTLQWSITDYFAKYLIHCICRERDACKA